jgi:hypothetical protein
MEICYKNIGILYPILYVINRVTFLHIDTLRSESEILTSKIAQVSDSGTYLIYIHKKVKLSL